jgi:hypothetical protein
MLIADAIQKSPIRPIGTNPTTILEPGRFGAIVAEPGMGKTSLLVQIGLYALLNEKPVLHISLNDPVHKVSLWYKELFRHFVRTNDIETAAEIWDGLQCHRFIMTFQVEGFSVPKLRERLTDVTEQGIFSPRVLMIDGLRFDEGVSETLGAIRELCDTMGLSAWFTASATPQARTIVNADPFDVVLGLRMEDKTVRISVERGGREAPAHLSFDPDTMLIR